MTKWFWLVLVLLACSRKPEPEYGSVCYLEDYYAAYDASGRPLDIADARRGAKLPGRNVKRPEYLTFRKGGRGTVEWEAFDFGWLEDVQYEPGSPKARIIKPLDGGVTAYPILVEGSPPKSVTFGFLAELCSFEGPQWMCEEFIEQQIVFATYTCREERL